MDGAPTLSTAPELDDGPGDMEQSRTALPMAPGFGRWFIIDRQQIACTAGTHHTPNQNDSLSDTYIYLDLKNHGTHGGNTYFPFLEAFVCSTRIFLRHVGT